MITPEHVSRLRSRGEHYSIFEGSPGQYYVSSSEHGAERIVLQYECCDWEDSDEYIADAMNNMIGGAE
jgi:hypothetical protein